MRQNNGKPNDYYKDGVCAAEGTYKELESSEDEWVRSFLSNT